MNSTQVLKVIKNFKSLKLARLRKNAVDMGRIGVHACGTVHCHGGWYAVATGNIFRLLIPINFDFEDGAKRMAKDLGFSEYHELPKWASRNPQIWGNTNGYFMFGTAEAFYHPTKRPEGAHSIHDIIDHWTEVYDRLKAIEEAEEKAKQPVVKVEVPVYENITKQISKIPTTQETPDVIRVEETVR